MDQTGDQRSSAATEFRTNTQSSATSRCVILPGVPYFSLHLIKFLLATVVCCLSGLEHYRDLNQPVTRSEADAIGEIVERALVSILPGTQMTLIGGFRR